MGSPVPDLMQMARRWLPQRLVAGPVPQLTASEERALLPQRESANIAEGVATLTPQDEEFQLWIGGDSTEECEIRENSMEEAPPPYKALAPPKYAPPISQEATHEFPAMPDGFDLVEVHCERKASAATRETTQTLNEVTADALRADDAQHRTNILGIHPGIMEPLLAATAASVATGAVPFAGWYLGVGLQHLAGEANPCTLVPWGMAVAAGAGAVVGTVAGSLSRNHSTDRDIASLTHANRVAAAAGLCATFGGQFAAWMGHLIVDSSAVSPSGRFISDPHGECACVLLAGAPGVSAAILGATAVSAAGAVAAPFVLARAAKSGSIAGYKKIRTFFGARPENQSPV